MLDREYKTVLLPEKELYFSQLPKATVNAVLAEQTTEALENTLVQLEKGTDEIKKIKRSYSIINKIIADIANDFSLDLPNSFDHTTCQKISLFFKTFLQAGTTFPGFFMSLQAFPKLKVRMTDPWVAIVGTIGLILSGCAAGYLFSRNLTLAEEKRRHNYALYIIKKVLLIELTDRTKIEMVNRAFSCKKWIQKPDEELHEISHIEISDMGHTFLSVVEFLQLNMSQLDIQSFALKTQDIIFLTKYLAKKYPEIDLTNLPIPLISPLEEPNNETIFDSFQHLDDGEQADYENPFWHAKIPIPYMNLALSLLGSSVAIFVFENFVKNAIASFFSIDQPESEWNGKIIEFTLLGLSLALGISLSIKNFLTEKISDAREEKLQNIQEDINESIDAYHEDKRCLNVLQKVEPLLIKHTFFKPGPELRLMPEQQPLNEGERIVRRIVRR